MQVRSAPARENRERGGGDRGMRCGGRHLELAEALLEVSGIILDGRQGMRGPDRLPVKAVDPGRHEFARQLASATRYKGEAA